MNRQQRRAEKREQKRGFCQRFSPKVRDAMRELIIWWLTEEPVGRRFATSVAHIPFDEVVERMVLLISNGDLVMDATQDHDDKIMVSIAPSDSGREIFYAPDFREGALLP